MTSRWHSRYAMIAPIALILTAALAPDDTGRSAAEATAAAPEACTRTVALRPSWGQCATLEVEMACPAPRRVVACWQTAAGTQSCAGPDDLLSPGERAEMLVCGAEAGLRLAACSDSASCRAFAAQPRRLQSSQLLN